MNDLNNDLRVWLFGDSHVRTDLRRGRESLIQAIGQSEQGDNEGAPPFAWDIAVDVGDMSGGQGVPEDDEGRELVRQFGALRDHPREAIYSVAGNHDRGPLTESANEWWRRWVDPLGETPQCSGVDSGRRPYPVDGTWERYAFRVGNLLFLMMSDVNEPTQSVGRGDLGGNPGGVVSEDTFQWWCDQVRSNPDALIVSVHHYMLKNTTVASGEWEGLTRDDRGRLKTHYHGYKVLGCPKGTSYLYFVGSRHDAGRFEEVLAEEPGRVALWFGGHTHTHPDDRCGGKSHIEKRWGTWFINAAALSKYHGSTNVPMSRHLTFKEGSNQVRVRCYLHSDHYASRGWYEPAERRIDLPRPFTRKT